jgi:hypothetical protein
MRSRCTTVARLSVASGVNRRFNRNLLRGHPPHVPSLVRDDVDLYELALAPDREGCPRGGADASATTVEVARAREALSAKVYSPRLIKILRQAVRKAR